MIAQLRYGSGVPFQMPLTLFLREAGAPVDKNLVERA
jgi:hypothetical protein